MPPVGPPKQLIIIYSGETLSIPNENESYTPAEGGLPAVAKEITDYEAQIVDYTRMRVLNEGGDPSRVKADFAAGMLGDSPYVLLDYGLWERPNDERGDMYVGLYMRMFADLRYTAVGAMLYERLSPERWEQYRAVAPREFVLLDSAGEPQGQPLPTVPIVTRVVHGDRWGIVAIPQPRLGQGPPEQVNAEAAERMIGFLDSAAAQLSRAHCRFSILLAANGPDEMYKNLLKDKRFTVVIGAAKRYAVAQGYGDMPANGAVLLPPVNPGGREIGVCHLYYPTSGDTPFQYYFSKKKCVHPVVPPIPYGKQVEAAIAQHKALTQAAKAHSRAQSPAAR